MTRDEWTPYDNPKRLLDRLIFPALKFAYEQGSKTGYSQGRWDGAEDAFDKVRVERKPDIGEGWQ